MFDPNSEADIERMLFDLYELDTKVREFFPWPEDRRFPNELYDVVDISGEIFDGLRPLTKEIFQASWPSSRTPVQDMLWQLAQDHNVWSLAPMGYEEDQAAQKLRETFKMCIQVAKNLSLNLTGIIL